MENAANEAEQELLLYVNSASMATISQINGLSAPFKLLLAVLNDEPLALPFNKVQPGAIWILCL